MAESSQFVRCALYAGLVFPADVVAAQNRFVPHARSRAAEPMRFREVTSMRQTQPELFVQPGQ
jgi:hypothetical protein